MTYAEADGLEQGDKVRHVDYAYSHGEVIRTSPLHVWIEWTSGTTYPYKKDDMPDIARDPEATHDA